MVRMVNPKLVIDIEGHATQRGVEKCREVMEQARRKVAGEDVGGWAARRPRDRAEVASVQAADTRSPIPPGSHAIKRLARSVERR